LSDAKYIQHAPTQADLFDTRFIRNVLANDSCTERVGRVSKSATLHELITGKAA
jgi:hypothetical protein